MLNINKKGAGDPLLLILVLMIFIALAVFLPIVQNEFDDTSVSIGNPAYNIEGMGSGNITETSVITDLKNILIWSGSLPTWLNMFLLVLKVLFIFLLIRLLRGVG